MHEERPSRSRHHKVIGGVCGGLGRFFHLDPVVFRVPLAVLSVIGGIGLVGYGVAWLMIPFEDAEESEGRRLLSGRVEGPGLTALLFVVAGCGLMLASLSSGGDATWFSIMVLAALAGAASWSRRRRGASAAADALAAAPLGAGGVAGAAAVGISGSAEGAAAAAGRRDETEREGAEAGGPARRRSAAAAVPAQTVADAPPEAQAPPTRPGPPSWWGGRPAGPAGAFTAAERASEYLWGPASARSAARAARITAPEVAAAGQEGPAGVWGPPAARPPVEPEQPCELRLGGAVLLLAMAACAAGTAATWGRDVLGEALVVGLASALLVFGAGLVVSAFVGRLGGGTIVSVVLTAAMLAGAAALPENISTSWSEPVWRPATVGEVQPEYEVGSGRAELDLSGLRLPQGRQLRARIEAGAGQVTVTLPRNVELSVDVEVGIGAYTYDEDGRFQGRGPSDSWGGVSQHRQARYGPPAGVTAGGTVELSVDMGVGYVVVERATAGGELPERSEPPETPETPEMPQGPGVREQPDPEAGEAGEALEPSEQREQRQRTEEETR